jgi:hypothetical protein
MMCDGIWSKTWKLENHVSNAWGQAPHCEHSIRRVLQRKRERNKGEKAYQAPVPTLVNRIWVAIRAAGPTLRAPIWEWMYVRNVIPVQRPIFMMRVVDALQF